MEMTIARLVQLYKKNEKNINKTTVLKNNTSFSLERYGISYFIDK